MMVHTQQCTMNEFLTVSVSWIMQLRCLDGRVASCWFFFFFFFFFFFLGGGGGVVGQAMPDRK